MVHSSTLSNYALPILVYFLITRTLLTKIKMIELIFENLIFQFWKLNASLQVDAHLLINSLNGEMLLKDALAFN